MELVYKRTRRKKDSQRQKVYHWEDSHLCKCLSHDLTGKELSLEQCTLLAKEVLADYNIPEVRVTPGHASKSAYYYPIIHKITLPRKYRRWVVVLHECAHAVVAEKYQDVEPAHGPVFMRVFLDLLARWTPASDVELRRAARASKIKVARRNLVPENSYRPERRKRWTTVWKEVESLNETKSCAKNTTGQRKRSTSTATLKKTSV